VKEHQPDHDPYCSDDVLLGEVRWPQETALVRLRLRESEEADHGRTIAELVPLSQPSRRRRSIHASPDVFEPEVGLTVGLSPTPRETGAIGEVVDST
jgi:hypothetical protein